MVFSPQPGRVIGSRYRLEALLGEGGMGSVWRATHEQLGTQVAVKFIGQALLGDAELYARFRSEAQVTASLQSAFIARTQDYDVFEGVPFIVMDLLRGESLKHRLARVRRLSPQETALLVFQVARGLACAHDAGVVHRDLKPDNIFLVRQDGENVAKILDFGIAKLVAPELRGTKTQTGLALGTPAYMSPEQHSASKEIDHRTDLWSLGAITYECLLGRRAFDVERTGIIQYQVWIAPLPIPSQHGPVPPGFDEWFARALARNPAQRFPTASAMAEALFAILSPETSLPRASSPAFVDASREPLSDSVLQTARGIETLRPLEPLPPSPTPNELAVPDEFQTVRQMVSALPVGPSPRPERTRLYFAAGLGALLLLGMGAGAVFASLQQSSEPKTLDVEVRALAAGVSSIVVKRARVSRPTMEPRRPATPQPEPRWAPKAEPVPAVHSEPEPAPAPLPQAEAPEESHGRMSF